MEGHKLVLAGGAIALAGMVVGGLFFGARPVAAQTGPFRECVIARQESVDTGDSGAIASADAAHRIAIPPGWEPIGGGGPEGGRDGWLGSVILCRR
jgi:hypothetical protein